MREARGAIRALVMGLVLVAGPAAGQELPGVEEGFSECEAAAREQRKERMEAAAVRLEAAASAMERDRPADALVVRARIRSQCRIPFASFLRKGALIKDSNELLDRALELDPRHLLARLTLGLNHYHVPAFLGRTDDAIRELERLLTDHAGSAEPPLAMAYLFLGNLYERKGLHERAAETWRRGAERFPAHGGLRTKARGAAPAQRGGAAAADTLDSAGGAAPESPAPAYTLPSITVEVSTYSVEDPRAATRLSKMEVYTLPGGTADVFQVFQTLPGVTRVTEGSDLYVRGGDPAEAPIYVDGARLFHPGRFETLSGSIFGVLDPAVMRTAYFSSGGFSARYGNALSGVVALETEGRPARRSWRAGANLVSVGGTLRQPLGERAGVWSTGMLTNTTSLLAVHGRSAEYPDAPTSEQQMLGLAFEPTDGLELRATALAESDRTTALVSAAGHDGPFRTEAATRLATAQVRAVSPDGKRVVRLSLGASTRASRFSFGVLERERRDRSLGARLDGHLARAGLTLRGGVEAALLDARTEGVVPAGEEIAPGSPTRTLDHTAETANHLGGYGELEWRVSRRLALIAGARADELPGETEWTLDRRIAAAYQVDDWTLRIAAGRFSQGRWRTRYALPTGSSPAGVPLRARHLVAGLQRDGATALRVEAYLKRYDAYVGEGGQSSEAPRANAGRVVGVDVLLRPPAAGAVAGWLTYSYLDGEVELEDGRRVPSPYDVTHTLTGVGKLSIERWELGLTGRHATGRPHTPILGAAPATPERPVAPIYGPLHSERLPGYVRLDGRLTRLVPVGGGVLVAYVEGLNLLDRGNVMAYTYDASYQTRRPVRTFFGDRTLVLGMEAQF